MSSGRIMLDLNSIPQGYGFLTMLSLGDLLIFGNTGNDQFAVIYLPQVKINLPLSNLVSISVLG